MSLLEDERQALLFRFNIGHVPEEAGPALASNPFTMKDAVAAWQYMKDNGKAIARLEVVLAESADINDEDKERLRLNLQRNKTNLMFIKDMKYNSTRDKVMLLLMIGDAAIVDPAFVDWQTQAVRVERKKPSEGVGYAAHVLINLNPTSRPIGYKTILERVPSLGRSTITGYLNWLLRERAREEGRVFDEVQPGGGSKPKRWHPKLDSELQAGLSLKQDLKDGQIAGVELICRRPPELDERDMKATYRTLRISTKGVADRLMSAASRVAWVNKITAWAKDNDYDEVLVKIRPDTKTRTFSARFAASISDAADVTYARTVDLTGFSKALDQCPDKINGEIRKKLESLMDQSSLWR